MPLSLTFVQSMPAAVRAMMYLPMRPAVMRSSLLRLARMAAASMDAPLPKEFNAIAA